VFSELQPAKQESNRHDKVKRAKMRYFIITHPFGIFLTLYHKCEKKATIFLKKLNGINDWQKNKMRKDPPYR
jgi:hypothetical protein